MYKNIFFDIDDTLWYTIHNSRETNYELYQYFNLDRYFNSFEQFFSIFIDCNEKMWSQYALGKVDMDYINRNRFMCPLRKVGITDESIAHNYSEKFFSTLPYKKTLLPNAGELLSYLRGSGKYCLYVLSNGLSKIQYQKLRSGGIYDYFDKIILSEDIGVAKPQQAIFDFAMSATHSVYKESLMIGDSWVNDIGGAQAVGMDQIYFNPRKESHSSPDPTYEVADLIDIEKIL